jgi:hypothetical protein
MISSQMRILALQTSVFDGTLKALSLEIWVSKTGPAGIFERMPIKTHYA